MLRVGLAMILTLVGTVAATGSARASGTEAPLLFQPHATTAAFPTVTPPGWYTNTYWYHWNYPWYAYYNWSQGPYANWMAARGVATYGYRIATPPGPLPATVTLVLPADAKLLFSGVVAAGTGEVRVFATPPLEPNQDYAYEMSAEIIKNGRIFRFSKTVFVHAADQVEVKFDSKDFAEVPMSLAPVPVPAMPTPGVPSKK